MTAISSKAMIFHTLSSANTITAHMAPLSYIKAISLKKHHSHLQAYKENIKFNKYICNKTRILMSCFWKTDCTLKKKENGGGLQYVELAHI